MFDFEKAISQLQRWAATEPSITRLWLHGSRAAGAPREGSDLDVAFELGVRESDVCAEAMRLDQVHTKPLSGELGVRVHLICVTPPAEPPDFRRCEFWSKEGRRSIYKRESDTLRG